MTARTTAIIAAISVATLVGLAIAPAMTFFAALAVASLVALDRSARAADDVFTSLAAR